LGQGLTSYHPGWRWQITPALPPATDPAGDPLCFIDEWRCVPIPEVVCATFSKSFEA
jgi:hypothetical protein